MVPVVTPIWVGALYKEEEEREEGRRTIKAAFLAAPL